MTSTLRTGSGWQSDLATSVSSNHTGEHLRITGQYIVNHGKVSYHCVLYLLNRFSNIFTLCIKCSFYAFTSCCCSLLITEFYFFCISILNMRRNGHIFLIRICKRAESTMLYPTCACPCCREVFNAQGRFFDKNGSLAEFPQLCLYERFDI
jgi:hypothetical protein